MANALKQSQYTKVKHFASECKLFSNNTLKTIFLEKQRYVHLGGTFIVKFSKFMLCHTAVSWYHQNPGYVCTLAQLK